MLELQACRCRIRTKLNELRGAYEWKWEHLGWMWGAPRYPDLDLACNAAWHEVKGPNAPCRLATGVTTVILWTRLAKLFWESSLTRSKAQRGGWKVLGWASLSPMPCQLPYRRLRARPRQMRKLLKTKKRKSIQFGRRWSECEPWRFDSRSRSTTRGSDRSRRSRANFPR